jgi:hypothetical protein
MVEPLSDVIKGPVRFRIGSVPPDLTPIFGRDNSTFKIGLAGKVFIIIIPGRISIRYAALGSAVLLLLQE